MIHEIRCDNARVLHSAPMRILVTGGRGFIGSHLCKALRGAGYEVTSADLRPASTKGDVVADVSEEGFWKECSAHDAVLHQAACTDTTVTDSEFMMRQNLTASMLMLSWAASHGADVVYASSAATYGNGPSPQRVGEHEEPLNVYGESKLLFDRHVRTVLQTSPVKIIGLRYFNVYGPGEEAKGKMASMIFQLAQQMKAGKRPRIFFDGSQKRDQVYVRDVITANLAALAAPKTASGIYNVGTGHAVSFNDIVSALNAALGTALEPEYFENPYSFYQTHTEADIEATKERLGYTPHFSLKEGVLDYAASGAL